MRRILTVVALAAVLVAATTRIGSAQAGGRLGKQELQSLLMTAKTKEDHMKLAAHYKAEAARLQAEAKEHEEMAEMDRKSSPPLAAKHPLAVGEQHCRSIAKNYRDAATKMQALAALHEDSAKKAAQ